MSGNHFPKWNSFSLAIPQGMPNPTAFRFGERIAHMHSNRLSALGFPRMRRTILALLIFTTITCGMVKTVSASPDCSKWIADYRQKLEADRQVQRLIRAKRRMHAYLKTKVHKEQKPKPVLVRTVARPRPRRPHLTPEEALRRFKIECGDLPTETSDGPLLPYDPTPAFTLARNFSPVVSADTPLASPPLSPQIPSGPNTPILPINPSPPGPPLMPPPGPPVTPPVPEPSSIVLVTSGLAGVAAIVRRRRENR